MCDPSSYALAGASYDGESMFDFEAPDEFGIGPTKQSPPGKNPGGRNCNDSCVTGFGRFRGSVASRAKSRVWVHLLAWSPLSLAGGTAAAAGATTWSTHATTTRNLPLR